MENALDPERGFYLEDWFVEPELCRVSRLNKTIRVEPKVMDVLVLLALNHHRVLRKDEIMSRVWGGVNVVENVLARAVSEIRKLFGDDSRKQCVIQTIPKVGYRMIANVLPATDGLPFAEEIHITRNTPVAPPRAAVSAIHSSKQFWIGAAVAAVLIVSILFVIALLMSRNVHRYEEVEIKMHNSHTGAMGQ